MAVPTTRFRQIPNNTPVMAVNTTAKRLAAITGEVEVSTGAGNEVKFGIADISVGAGNSEVVILLWDVTANGGNTTVKNFKTWLATNGFDIAGSVLKLQPLSGADQGAPTLTKNYIANASPSFSWWTTMPEAEPGAINVWPSDEGISMGIAGGASDDVVMLAMYAAIASGETTGFYFGLTAGYQLRFNFKYTYS